MIRIWLTTTVLALLTMTTGCFSMLGAGAGVGIGSAIPDRRAVGPHDRLPRLSSQIEVRVARRGSSDDWITGVYVGVCDGALIVSNGSGEHAVALAEILELRVRNGTYLVEGVVAGVLTGVVIDAISIGVALHNYNPR